MSDENSLDRYKAAVDGFGKELLETEVRHQNHIAAIRQKVVAATRAVRTAIPVLLEEAINIIDEPPDYAAPSNRAIAEMRQLKRDVDSYKKAFSHMHVNNGYDDSCKQCGLDLRNPIHSI